LYNSVKKFDVSLLSPMATEFTSLSVRELRDEIKRRKLDATGCLEKAELIALLHALGNQATNIATAAAGTGALATLSVSELKRLLVCHGAESEITGAQEKHELVSALESCLCRCPICLDDSDAASTQDCGACRSKFHQNCAAQHALSSAEAARLPLLCPVPGCKARWPSTMVAWALHEEEQLQRYNASVRSFREQRQGAAALSPRTAEALRGAGVRFCPACNVPIEKQEGGLLHGCDKMTCRCGCKFCFKCGVKAGPHGQANCNCVAAHHSYLSHESVMRDYDDNPVDDMQGGLGHFTRTATRVAEEFQRAAAAANQSFPSGFAFPNNGMPADPDGFAEGMQFFQSTLDQVCQAAVNVGAANRNCQGNRR